MSILDSVLIWSQHLAVLRDNWTCNFELQLIIWFPAQKGIHNKNKNVSQLFTSLLNVIANIPQEDDYVVLGDFNAHIGSRNATDYSNFVEKSLQHKESNENGFLTHLLMYHFDLRACNTFAKSKSVLTTWSNSIDQSQIDHILLPIASKIQIKEKSIKAIQPLIFKTDHKIKFL